MPEGERLDPYAGDLVESLRALAYDLPTALADLIDNSITAKASTVWIRYCSDPGQSWVAVIDDGHGMDDAQLREAMRFARAPTKERARGDLGRFGLGLKTASLSQARMLTVLSRGSSGSLAARTWDIDEIAKRQEWYVRSDIDPEARMILDQLGFTGAGTVVLWRRLDKLDEGSALRRRIQVASRELSLLFHIYLERGKLKLIVGNTALQPADPYLRGHSATQDRGSEVLEHDGHRIVVNPLVLPHPSRLSPRDVEKARLPGGFLDRQGFYIYREERLILAGGWLGFSGMNKSNHTRLARVAVTLPPGADLSWEVDVRKSFVRPPNQISQRLAELAEDVRDRSTRVFTHRGTPVDPRRTLEGIAPVWQQVRRLGRLEYRINRGHPVVAALLTGADAKKVEGLMRLVETYLPADLIMREVSDPVPGAEPESLTEEAERTLAGFREILQGLPSDPVERAALADLLAQSEPFSRYPGLVREIIDADLQKET
ncbi:ATP-binding protein [Actinomadura sp. 21ATH]|uniref:ATP-binding protein n=1 Tax=Actinomadura sp. 21ATH TaxID=1735444 RepID=UPI0035C201CB